jgi:hypothetical protein
MPEEIDLPDLLMLFCREEILLRLPTPTPIILIDGNSGTGKTTLSQKIYFSAPHTFSNPIALDDCLEKNKGSYFSSINWDSLAEKIKSSSQYQYVPIIEGIQVLKIAEKLALKDYFHIYIMEYSYIPSASVARMSAPELFDDAVSADQFIDKYISDRPWRVELVRYHKEYHPERCANLLVRRIKET